MFAICLYDPRVEKVYLIRDRLGIKPLYFLSDKNNFIFGSEIKSIVKILPKKPAINKQSVWHYLTLRYVPSPETIWENIHKLEPGHYLEYDLKQKKFHTTKYWSFDFNSKKIQKNRNYEKEFETLFLESVEKRLLASDVPVGILLSGGLDSSCLAAAAIELGHKNFHTFSVGFEDGGEFSELQYAKKVASHIGSKHHEIIISKKQFIDFMEEFVWHTDEPLADLASIPLYYLSKLASKHVKVVLSGEGADEILAGYNLDQLAQKLTLLKAIDRIPPSLLRLFPLQSLKNLATSGYENHLKFQTAHMTNIFSEDEKNQMCKFKVEVSTKKYIENLYQQSTSPEPLDQLQNVYCLSWLVEDLLMKADKMSMAASIELRVPFLDHKLVEWASILPIEWKTGSFRQGFTTKKILRKFAAGRIPQDIIIRPKQGFPVPAYQWLKGSLNSFVQKNLQYSGFKEYFNTESFVPVLENLKNTDTQAAHKIWNLIILSLWMKKWTN